MGMVRFFVEGCGVDMNELHRESGRESVDSPLLLAAKGAQWWHTAMVVPHFIEWSAESNIRNHLGQTPLHVALHSKSLFREDIVEL
ncbi:hypothetical protein RRF57_012773 [Xylaria bambusicola]|uniref:Uncharacterized protein n=1 Tax=Xylaria bambusicola TaxID=326684 RepID=A0AAN7V0Z4_9PEZI